jgi:hypothetical protein
MKILAQMVANDCIQNDDQLFFEFKNFTFYTKVSEEGVLHDCYYKTSRDGEVKSCFEDVSGFDSLTHWTDVCVQEIANEYVTRFSAWKRVRRHKTNQLMGEIRAQYRHISTPTPSESPCKSCDRLKRRLFRLFQQKKLLCEVLKTWHVKLTALKIEDPVFKTQSAMVERVLDSCGKEDQIVIRRIFDAVEGGSATSSSSTAVATAANHVTPPQSVQRTSTKRKHVSHSKESTTNGSTATSTLHASKTAIEKIIMDDGIDDDAFNQLLVRYFKETK